MKKWMVALFALLSLEIAVTNAFACPALPVDISFDGSPFNGDRGLIYDPASNQLMLRDRDGSRQIVYLSSEQKTWCILKEDQTGAVGSKVLRFPTCFKLDGNGDSQPLAATDNQTKELYGRGRVSNGGFVLTDKNGFNHISISATPDGFRIRYNKKVCDNGKFSGCSKISHVFLHKAIQGSKDLSSAVKPLPESERKITVGQGEFPGSHSVIGCSIENNSKRAPKDAQDATGIRD